MHPGLSHTCLPPVMPKAAVERLSQQFSHGAAALVEENRRAAEEANAVFREESRRRQQQYLTDLSALNREVRPGDVWHAFYCGVCQPE